MAFDPLDPDILVAGGADSGVFLSSNGGTRWQLVTDPNTPGASGTPHIPRPLYAHFDHDGPGGEINLYLGTRGRGAWRLTFLKVAMPEIQVPAPPFFAPACAGSKATGTLNVCNTSAGNLIVSGITSSSPDFTVVAPSAGFPVTISHDFCFPFQVGFNPTSPGPKSTNLTIASNDPNFPSLVVAANATVGSGTAVDDHRRHRQFRRAVRQSREVQGSAAHDQQQRRVHADHQRNLVIVGRVPDGTGAELPVDRRAG